MVKVYIFFLYLFVFCLSIPNGQAQDLHLQIQKLGIEDGLSSYNLEHFYQDSRGFIWLGTDYGLNRFDGKQIKTYTKEESGLCNNLLRFISEDPKGNLWLFSITENNSYCLSILDPITEQVYSPEDYLGTSLPFNIAQTVCYPWANGSIIFREEVGGREEVRYFEYNGKSIQKRFESAVFKAESQEPFRFGELYKLKENYYSIYIKNYRDWRRSKVFYVDSIGHVLDSAVCPKAVPELLNTGITDGKLCMNCQINKEDGWRFAFVVNDRIKDRNVIHVRPNLFHKIAYHKGKVYVLHSDSLKIYQEDGTLEKEFFTNIKLRTPYSYLFVDRDENLWFCDHRYLYIVSLVENGFQKELSDQGFKIRGIVSDTVESLYAMGLNFVNKKEKNKAWEDFLEKPIEGFEAQYNNQSFLGALAVEDDLWLGGENSHLLRFDWRQRHYQQYYVPPLQAGVQRSIIWISYQAEDGRLWIGTSRGIHYLDKNKDVLIPFGGENAALSNSVVYAFYTNTAGTWLSTSSGLFLVDLSQEKVLAHYSNEKTGENYIPTSHIAHLYEDELGVFWLATKGSGLVRWNPQTKAFKQYTQKGAGLSHNVLYAVYGDDFGNLWISSQRGLMRFNREQEQIKIYLEENGLPHNEFNTIAHYKDKTGRLYFGGQNGLIHFHPKDIQVANKDYPLEITGCYKKKIGLEGLTNLTAELIETNVIRIQPDDKSFHLSFALLDYRNSKNHQYAYQIIGYDDSWNFQSENQLNINNLPYGNYELKLKAKGANSALWTNYPTTISIQVLYPFYLQTWFITLLVLALIGILYSIFKWRIQLLEQRKKELEQIVLERTAKIEKDKEVIEEQAEELKNLDKVKSRFFANISHELRTPLTLILGPLSFILDDPNALDEAEVQRQLQTMHRNGKSLMELIEEILDLSKLEANKLELIEEPTPVVSFFEQIFAVFEPQFKAEGLNYELTFLLDNRAIHLLLDRKKMRRVLNNFLSNAIKFTPRGGTIRTTISEDQNDLKICVSDTGKGVHPNDLPYVFERFYQSKQADQKLYGGTGIGLALVSEFASLMDGSVSAESTLGAGSQFYFKFRKKVAETTSFPITAMIEELDETEIGAIGTDFTILVVEDNSDMRAFVCQLLSKQYKVIEATNGAEGLAKIKALGKDLHLIVSDVMMPEVDGLTLLKTIKSSPEWGHIPVLMLTALAAERDKLTALTIGVDDYLTKPFSVSELIVRVQNLLYNYYQRMQWQKEMAVSDLYENKTELAEDAAVSVVDQAWIKDVEATVQKQLGEELLNVEKLASLFFLSKRQLTRKIKSITGLTPAKFIKEVQLQAARKELENGTVLSVTEVAYNNGFEFPATFSTVFKKRFGISPSDYLKSNSYQ